MDTSIQATFVSQDKKIFRLPISVANQNRQPEKYNLSPRKCLGA
ncbi:hypothetical protein [Wielerella bovis]|nr:hypothetical protein [Wielerella bovis]